MPSQSRYESQKERDLWKDLDVDERITLKWILEKQDSSMDWILQVRIGSSALLLWTP
jgi:hypothetical protein